jgi:glycosyltransferase involved in cell wall biosynthesis
MSIRSHAEIVHKWKTRGHPVVSICSSTYNHEQYIRQCLDSLLMQETDFEFEIIIHDDASTDKTADIIMEYVKEYPDIIKPILQKENQFSKGFIPIMTYVFPRVRAKYVAICEGDDYWTDPLKLQKQIAFLEASNDYVLCSGKCLKRDGDTFHAFRSSRTGVVTFTDIAHDNIVVTTTAVFRNIFTDGDFYRMSDYLQYATNGDIFLYLLLLMNGKGYILPDCIAVYRMHDGGVISKQPDGVKYSRVFQVRNILLRYLKDIRADEQYIKDVEHGFILYLESYLTNNRLTEEFVEKVPKPILCEAVNKLMSNYRLQIDTLSNNLNLAQFRDNP